MKLFQCFGNDYWLDISSKETFFLRFFVDSPFHRTWTSNRRESSLWQGLVNKQSWKDSQKKIISWAYKEKVFSPWMQKLFINGSTNNKFCSMHRENKLIPTPYYSLAMKSPQIHKSITHILFSNFKFHLFQNHFFGLNAFSL